MYARIMGTEIEGFNFAAIVISCHFGLLLYEYMDMFILLVVFLGDFGSIKV